MSVGPAIVNTPYQPRHREALLRQLEPSCSSRSTWRWDAAKRHRRHAWSGCEREYGLRRPSASPSFDRIGAALTAAGFNPIPFNQPADGPQTDVTWEGHHSVGNLGHGIGLNGVGPGCACHSRTMRSSPSAAPNGSTRPTAACC